MLSLVQIERMAANLLEIYQAIENDLLMSVASRFSALEAPPTSGMLRWQVDKLNQLGGLNAESIKVIAKYAKKTEKEISTLLTEAGFKAIEYDERVYAKALEKGLLQTAAGPARASAGIQQILSAAIGNAKQVLNLVNTTAAQSANKAFTDIVNKVYLETSLGVRSYTDAIRSAVRDLADKGITGVSYSGKGKTINYQVDTAVRRAVLTSTSQTAGKVQLQRAQEWGNDLVEVSSHLGARESHAVWQGKVFCLHGARDGYGDFYTVTGYGTAMGLKGINCSHEFYPFFEGLSDQTFKSYDLEENKRVADEQAEQRALERDIRQQKRRIIAADAVGDEEGKLAAQLKLKEKESKMADFLEQTGRTQRKDRQQVVGFGRSEASQATWAAKKAPLPKVIKAKDVTLQSTLGDERIDGIIPKGADVSSVRVIAGRGTSIALRYAPKLVEKYGGDQLQWQKKSGKIETANFQYEVHWDELNGQQSGAKLKGRKKK